MNAQLPDFYARWRWRIIFLVMISTAFVRLGVLDLFLQPAQSQKLFEILGLLLALVLLEALREIYVIVKPHNPRSFNSVESVMQHVLSANSARFVSSKSIRLRFFGLTMNRSWLALRNCILQPNGSNSLNPDLRRFSVEFHVIDPARPELPLLNPRWHNDALVRIKEISGFLKRYDRLLKQQEVSITLRRVRRVPMLHGIMVDDDQIYYSHTSIHESPSGRPMVHASMHKHVLLVKNDDPDFEDVYTTLTTWYRWLSSDDEALPPLNREAEATDKKPEDAAGHDE